ncbi:MAG: TolB family protein [Anaerolineae bacterium]
MKVWLMHGLRARFALPAIIVLLVCLLFPSELYAVRHFQVGPQGQIVFVSDMSGNSEIYLINADGTGLRQLTNNPQEDWLPSWSLAGDKIVFQSMVNEVFNVFLMNADGSGQIQLTNWTKADTGGFAGAQRPVWSPDGTRIAVSFEGASGTFVYIIDLVRASSYPFVEGRDPSWSPDGRKLAFVWRDEIWTLNLDGTEPTQLTFDQIPKLYPAWSPDGTRLAYTAMTADRAGIYVLNSDGSGTRLVIDKSAFGLSWSPDGQRLVFASEGYVWIINSDGSSLQWLAPGSQPDWSKGMAVPPPPPTQPTFPTLPPPIQPTLPPPPPPSPPPAALSGKIAFTVFNLQTGKYDIYVANADGSNRHLVADQMRQPAFDPGGGRLAANGDKNMRMHLFVMNADGTNQVEITRHVEDGQPRWSPDGMRLVFASTMHADRKPRIYILDSIPASEKDRQEGRAISHGIADAVGRHPFWMLDGRIIYGGCDSWAGGGSCGLMIVPPEGGIAMQLTRDASDTAPVVYGNLIVFMSMRDGNWELYSMNLDGSNLRRLTSNAANDGLPVFSPDGRTVAFISDEGGVWAIWAIDPDGSNRRKLFDIGGTFGSGEYDWTSEQISWAP